MPRLIDLTGHQYGRWSVLSRAPNQGEKVMWNCRCECGAVKPVQAGRLRFFDDPPCGCMPNNLKHGMLKSREYSSWKAMRARCLNPTDKDWPNYGGRGISICDEWDDFSVFFSDMGHRPEGQTLGRMDNAGNYTPSNCRWETPTQQQRNRRGGLNVQAVRQIRKLVADGLPHSKIAKRFGVTRSNISHIATLKTWSDV